MFTPGPWQAFGVDDLNINPGIDSGETAIVYFGDRGYSGKGVRGRNSNLDEARANATLMAAAPTMYAILSEIVEISFKYRSLYLNGTIGDKIRDALKSATYVPPVQEPQPQSKPEPTTMPEPRPRNLVRVLDRILPLIPVEEVAFIRRLIRQRDDLAYHAPEEVQGDALVISSTIRHHFEQWAPGAERPEWAEKVLAIWTAKDVEPGDYQW